MASPHLPAVIARIGTQLQIATGVSPYTYNLSVSDAVQYNAIQIPPPRDPTVYLVDANGAVIEGRTLTDYLRTWTIGFVGLVSSAGNAQSRMVNAAHLLDDIHIALESNRRLFLALGDPLYGCEDLVIRNPAIGYTDLFGAPGWAYCTGEIEIRYALQQATGA